jgi:hypothetical protein
MAYKVFTNGSPLPASDLNTYLMNQSVMVFANSTARSAALTAPTEGMVTYLEDTGLVYVFNGSSWVDINDNSGAIPKSTVTTAGDLIVADGNASVTRLGIGTNGQVLQSNGTTATWATPAGGGAWTLLSTTSLTGSSTISVNSINQGYKFIKAEAVNVEIGTGGNVYFRFRNGTTNLSNNYVSWEASVQAWSTSASANIFIAGGANLTANTPFNYEITVSNYASTSERKSFFGFGGGVATNNSGFSSSGQVNSLSAIDSIQLVSANNYTAGTLRIYGGN